VGDDTSVQAVLTRETVGTIDLLICISTDLMSETRIAATLAFLEEILRES
jgi:hypothetical protein